MTKNEALELALEALKEAQTNDDGMEKWDRNKKAIIAIKEALAQLEQAPVAWMSKDEHEVYTSKQVDGCFQQDHIPLYTTPPQHECVELTDEEIDYLYIEHRGDGGPTAICEQFARAVLAKSMKKNT